MTRLHRNPWLDIGMEAWTLSVDAASVIGLRTMKMAMGGPAAETEARLMVTEKIGSAVDLQTSLMTGGLGFTLHGVSKKALKHYAGKVGANKRRLKEFYATTRA